MSDILVVLMSQIRTKRYAGTTLPSLTNTRGRSKKILPYGAQVEPCTMPMEASWRKIGRGLIVQILWSKNVTVSRLDVLRETELFQLQSAPSNALTLPRGFGMASIKTGIACVQFAGARVGWHGMWVLDEIKFSRAIVISYLKGIHRCISVRHWRSSKPTLPEEASPYPSSCNGWLLWEEAGTEATCQRERHDGSQSCNSFGSFFRTVWRQFCSQRWYFSYLSISIY